MKLSKTQNDLLDAMKAGAVVRWMPYNGRLTPEPYYYRDDNFKRCTAAARALLEKGVVEMKNRDFRGSHTLHPCA